MTTDGRPRKELLAEIESLRSRMQEVEETMQAIRGGEVDALVISGPDGDRVFTLQGAEHPYRVLVESMNEGAANLAADGTILYCNSRLSAMLQVPLERLIGMSLASYVAVADREVFAARLDRCAEECDKVEISLVPADGSQMPVLFSCCAMQHPTGLGVGVVLADIRAQKETEAQLREAQLQTRMAEERQRAAEALREANIRLKASLAEKEVLLKEIHHRVKNNLQVISSLMSLQAEGSEDAALREILHDLIYRVHSMALIHEKLYQSPDLASINFADYARGLLGYIWRSHGAAASSIQLILDLQPVLLSVHVAVPCGLILNELVGNALKHGFNGRSGGNVTVSLRRGDDGRVFLTVSDDGVGLPAGFDWRKATSLGLRLVQMLEGQIGAAINADAGGATRFEIVFDPHS